MKLHRHFLPMRLVAAFTMIEVAISIAIVAFALVAIIGVLPHGLNVQRDNREDTIINQDATFLMEAIRSGSTNITALTNFIDEVWIQTTNYAAGTGVVTRIYGTNRQPNFLLAGLSTPHHFPNSPVTNFVMARIRAFSGPLGDQGTNLASRNFAFSYLVTSELLPYVSTPPFLTNYSAALNQFGDVGRSNNFVLQMQREVNLYELRLTFQWPLFPDPNNTVFGMRPGLGQRVFRTLIPGSLSTNRVGTNLYTFTPSEFDRSAAAPLNP